MSDRIKGLTVTLKDNFHDDDAQGVIDAIRLLRGVVSGHSHIADAGHHFAVETAKNDLRNKMRDVLWPVIKP